MSHEVLSSSFVDQLCSRCNIWAGRFEDISRFPITSSSPHPPADFCKSTRGASGCTASPGSNRLNKSRKLRTMAGYVLGAILLAVTIGSRFLSGSAIAHLEGILRGIQNLGLIGAIAF